MSSPVYLVTGAMGLASFIKATAGFGEAIIFHTIFRIAASTAAETVEYRVKYAVALLSVTSLVTSGVLVLLNYKHIEKKIVLSSIAGVVTGSPVGNLCLNYLPSEALQRSLGALFFSYGYMKLYAMGKAYGMKHKAQLEHSGSVEMMEVEQQAGAATTTATVAITRRSADDTDVPIGADLIVEGVPRSDDVIGQATAATQQEPKGADESSCCSTWLERRVVCACAFGWLGGFCGSLFGIFGPPLMVYAAMFPTKPATMRANFQVLSLCLASVNIAMLYSQGSIVMETMWDSYVGMISAGLVAVAIGSYAVRWVDQTLAITVILVLLCMSSTVMSSYGDLEVAGYLACFVILAFVFGFVVLYIKFGTVVKENRRRLRKEKIQAETNAAQTVEFRV